MEKKIIVIVTLTLSAILGIIVGLNDNLFTKIETNSGSIINKKADDISGDETNKVANDASIVDSEITNISGELQNTTNNISDESIVETDNNINENEFNKNVSKPDSVKAVYATGWVMGTKSIRDSMINSIKENGFNAIVIDIKDEAGQLSYDSTVQTALDIKASRNMIKNVSDVIKELKENDIYVIGRIVTFKDPIYASKVQSIAYKKSDGTTWKDYSGNSWPNPYDRNTWNYPIELAKEAAALGFEEIQFDYIRFPSSEGKTSTIVYGFDRETSTKSDIICEFLEKASNELNEYNVVVSADVFGITTKRDGDFENIGQDFSRIASIVDVICPMVYPSHYANNEYKISLPDKNPYQIVYRAIEDVYKRYNNYTSGNKEIHMAEVRPYLQDFTASWLGNGNYLVYGTNEVKEQIQASYDLGIESFTLWDPSNKYCYSALKEVTKSNKSGDNISGDN